MEEIIALVKTGQNDLLSEKLAEHPALAQIKTDQGISLLQLASYCRNQSAVDTIRRYKKSLDLFEAASLGETEIVTVFLSNEPETIDSFSPDGFTALGLASFFGHLLLVKVLLEKGANPNIASTNQFKVAPIHSACAISNLDIAALLITYGANVNAKQQQGVTPLHSAAHHGHFELSKLLIDSGADPNAKLDNGQTPLAMAMENGFQETAELLIQHGAY
jgi:uncharacterized protein